ncbi:leishmanolysin-like peptidase [Acanthaster planci]|uniref:Leishmanolysin-like peptidase n=1 Tax=Acanthaster planci TaxID=133434 RepID=A0A8B7Y319_ACAPL|nr:leishmanolysin-like peptidase [Acanthaster planci]XP_022087572.1 leishmanolysin-like peptidase [Acanthaster planci]XP_022087573.1 leishmanolysin-like peptidase [Acanthaster planci]XP_022087574.1 leishmanolysin-like peptidase [Acanthaster planci]
MTSWLRGALFLFVTTALVQCLTQVFSCPARGSKCIFDEVRPKALGKNTMVHYDSARGKRSAGDLFRPIRITASIVDLEKVVDTTDVARMRTIVDGAISIIGKILTVVPVSGPLLMTRSDEACSWTFTSGINSGKCAHISQGYVGEKCLDDFLIPDEHLQGLWTWNSTYPQPVHQVYPDGPGLPDTDTVLYVKATHTSQCSSGQVVAYASYCKLDQNNRPIAGVVNFCPEHLKDDLYDEQKFILLAVHEIFHVLGFSSSLFNKFKECSESANGLNCIDRCTTTGTDSQGTSRLITPAVTAHAQKHFDCPESGFGGPLENQQADDGISSHWETRMMYGSIMAPIIDQPHQTFLDNLTLAVFEDSGWYRVNYEYAEEMPWGRNQGCEFGRESRCQTAADTFFCNGSSLGCHYLHRDKATCSSNDYLEECRVMKGNIQDYCSVASDGSPSVRGEVFHEDSRCFVSSAISIESRVDPCDFQGVCYLTRCNNDSRSYEVKVGEADWLSCPDNTTITIPGYHGTVQCPSTEIICRQKTSILDLVDAVCDSCTTITGPTPQGPDTTPAQPVEHALCVSLEIGEIDFSILDGEEQMHVFSEAVVKGICDITEIHESRIHVKRLSAGSSPLEQGVNLVCVTFDIAEAEESSDIPAYVAYWNLEEAVFSNQMQVKYLDMNYTAVSIRLLSGEEPTSPQPQSPAVVSESDVSTWIALGACLALLVVVVVVGCACHKAKRNNAVGPSDGDAAGETPAERIPGMVYVVKEKTVTKL